MYIYVCVCLCVYWPTSTAKRLPRLNPHLASKLQILGRKRRKIKEFGVDAVVDYMVIVSAFYCICPPTKSVALSCSYGHCWIYRTTTINAQRNAHLRHSARAAATHLARWSPLAHQRRHIACRWMFRVSPTPPPHNASSWWSFHSNYLMAASSDERICHTNTTHTLDSRENKEFSPAIAPTAQHFTIRASRYAGYMARESRRWSFCASCCLALRSRPPLHTHCDVVTHARA